jgi:hypothetical protein
MAKTIIGDTVHCDHGREAPLSAMEQLDAEKKRHGREEQGKPGRHGCTVCAWRLGYEAALSGFRVAH